jgi:Domain of unknown function (DUF5658)
MNSLKRTRFTVFLLALLAAAAPRASAQTADSLSSMSAVSAAVVAPAPLAAAPGAMERPAALVPLYISFAALQAVDTASTLRVLRGGGGEANPLMASVAGSPATLVGVKAAASAVAIVMCERLWKEHRGAAIATMIASNVAYSMVAAHNLRAGGQRLQ